MKSDSLVRRITLAVMLSLGLAGCESMSAKSQQVDIDISKCWEELEAIERLKKNDIELQLDRGELCIAQYPQEVKSNDKDRFNLELATLSLILKDWARAERNRNLIHAKVMIGRDGENMLKNADVLIKRLKFEEAEGVFGRFLSTINYYLPPSKE